MKKYKCPNCSTEFFSPLSECSDCGSIAAPHEWVEIEVPLPPKPVDATCLHLCGDKGELVLHRLPQPMDVGTPLLKQTSAAVNCSERVQFRIRWSGERCFITPLSTTKNATAVNGQILMAETEILQGDSISIIGRSSGRIGLSLCALYYA